MGFGSTSHNATTTRKNFKFGRRIYKPKRHETLNTKQKCTTTHRCYKKNRIFEYTQAFSPEYHVSQPVQIRPLCYSDEYKPQMSFQEETNQVYSCYIDSLLILKMQREEQRNQELIEQLNNIKFEETV